MCVAQCLKRERVVLACLTLGPALRPGSLTRW